MAEVGISLHACTATIGKMNATSCVLPLGPLFYCHLQMALTNTLERSYQCFEAKVLTQDCWEELVWWDSNMCRWNGKTLIQRE